MVIGYWLTGYTTAALKNRRWSMMNGICHYAIHRIAQSLHSELIDFNHFAQQYLGQNLRNSITKRKRLAYIARHHANVRWYAAKDTRQNHAIVLAEWL